MLSETRVLGLCAAIKIFRIAKENKIGFFSQNFRFLLKAIFFLHVFHMEWNCA